MADRDEEEQARRARADFEERIYRRSTDTSAADPVLALPAPAWATATPACGHVRLDWEPVDGAAGYLIERRDPDGTTRLVQHAGIDVPAVPHGPIADTAVARRRRLRAIASRPLLGAEYPAWNWSEWKIGRTERRRPGAPPAPRGRGHSGGTLERVWWMVGSERLTQLRFGGRRARQRHRRRVRARPSASPTRIWASRTCGRTRSCTTTTTSSAARPTASLSFDFTRGRRDLRPAPRDGAAPGRRAVVHARRDRPRPRRRPSSTTAPSSRRRRTGREWRAVVSALAGHLVERYGVDEVAAGPSRCGTSRTSRSSGPARRRSTCGCTTRPRAAIKEVDARAARRRPGHRGRRNGSRRWPRTRERTGTPLDLVTTHTYGNLPVDIRPSLRRHGFDAAADLVDRVGRRLDRTSGPDPRPGRRRPVRAVADTGTCRAGWRRCPTG